jgi:Domain of unknown function (DUF5668)
MAGRLAPEREVTMETQMFCRGHRYRDGLDGEGSMRRLIRRIFFGVAVMAVGVVFLLHNLGLAKLDHVYQYWPMLIAVLAIGHFISRGVLSMGGHLHLLACAALQMACLERFDLMERWWPAAIVWIGIIIVLRALFPGKSPQICHDTDERQS